MIDNGPLAATDRYVVNLGPIDLTMKGERTFRLSNLPKEHFVGGIELTISSADRSALEDKVINPVVWMEVLERDGQAVFRTVGPLKEWTWSVPSIGRTAFVYQRGEPGTFFVPMPGKEYRLKISVLEPYNAHGDT